mmetsp:Transcript_43842/g.83717  ORF Transcript_43842/g.83717 Transcript_43842/m.83717 type:complete len:206 (-) Transcript_43842:307-924(-)
MVSPDVVVTIISPCRTTHSCCQISSGSAAPPLSLSFSSITENVLWWFSANTSKSKSTTFIAAMVLTRSTCVCPRCPSPMLPKPSRLVNCICALASPSMDMRTASTISWSCRIATTSPMRAKAKTHSSEVSALITVSERRRSAAPGCLSATCSASALMSVPGPAYTIFSFCVSWSLYVRATLPLMTTVMRLSFSPVSLWYSRMPCL